MVVIRLKNNRQLAIIQDKLYLETKTLPRILLAESKKEIEDLKSYLDQLKDFM